MQKLVIVGLLVFAVFVLTNNTKATTEPNLTWIQKKLEDFNLKIQKVEALITLMKSEKDQTVVLYSEHLVKQISQVQVPGMEPAKQPVFSTPIQAPAKGHWEQRGLFGRNQVWVSEQQSNQQNYSSCGAGGCSPRGLFGRR